MKREVRFLGIDDAPFRFADERTRIIGVVTRGASYVEGVLSRSVEVDGADATDTVAEMVSRTRFRPMLRAIFLNGVTLGGFNVVDLDALHQALALPVIAIVRDEPDHAGAEAALTKHFPDAEERIRRLRALRPGPVQNGRHTVWVNARGVSTSDAGSLIQSATIRGAIPEPLRLAHVIASGVERGESRGPV